MAVNDKDVQFEFVPCPLCDSTDESLFIQAYDRFDFNGSRKHRLVRCRSCGFIYLNPRPAPLSLERFYQSPDYHPFASLGRPRGWVGKLYPIIRRWSVRWKRRLIEHRKSSGRILDVGCGTGEFLAEMRGHKWDVVGLERDSAAAEFVRRAYGLDAQTVDLEDFSAPEESFDVVTFWHVLEHLPNPKGALHKVRQLLKADGLALVAVPNIDSLDFAVYREDWVALDVPRHFHHFDYASFEHLARRANLFVVEAHSMPLDAFYNCLMSEALASRRMRRNFLKQGVGMVRALVVATASLMAGARCRRGGRVRGSSLVYYLRKR